MLLSAAIFILLEVAALAMLRSSSTMQDIAINRASLRTSAALWGAGERFRYHFRAEKLNEQLADRNAELELALREYQLQEAKLREEQNSPYPKLRDNYSFISATIVKMGRNGAHNFIILNKGSEDGVTPQCGIITGEGVVGVVSAVGKHYSYGLTLMNPNLSISSRVGNSGVTAPLVWDGLSSNGAKLSDIAPHLSIEPGDTVRTSGFSTIFPAGIPIGTTGKTSHVDGSTIQVDVTLFQDFSNIHYVTIVRNLDRSEIEELEAAGENSSAR